MFLYHISIVFVQISIFHRILLCLVRGWLFLLLMVDSVWVLFFRNIVGMMSSSHDLDGIPNMVCKISWSISVENLSKCGMPFGSSLYACVTLKSFCMFCILLRKNATKCLASCWSDMDSGSGICLFWPVISVTILYTFCCPWWSYWLGYVLSHTFCI